MMKVLILMGIIAQTVGMGTKYGYLLGNLNTNAHQVSGQVYVVDNNRIRICNFNYDGTGPDAFFYVGTSSQGSTPNEAGTKINDERGTADILPAYANADIVLTMPSGVLVNDLQWLSVWCRQFRVDFGSIAFTDVNVKLPAQQAIGEFSRLAHGVRSGTVTILDAKTIRITNLNYDGAGPDAYFLAGKGIRPDHNTAVKVPNELGSTDILSGYTGQTITLTLPGDLTFYDVDYLSMYCIRFTQNFGDVRMPANLNVPPVIGDEKSNDNSETVELPEGTKATKIPVATPKPKPHNQETTTTPTTIRNTKPANGVKAGERERLRLRWLEILCTQFEFSFRTCDILKQRNKKEIF